MSDQLLQETFYSLDRNCFLRFLGPMYYNRKMGKTYTVGLHVHLKQNVFNGFYSKTPIYIVCIVCKTVFISKIHGKCIHSYKQTFSTNQDIFKIISVRNKPHKRDTKYAVVLYSTQNCNTSNVTSSLNWCYLGSAQRNIQTKAYFVLSMI